MSWKPQVYTSRRIAGRVLRAHRAEVIVLSGVERRLCVDGITQKFLSTNLRQKLGKLWVLHGIQVVQCDMEDPERRSEVDDSLDSMVEPK